MADFIQVRDLGKRFRGTVALAGVSTSIPAPGLVGLVGKNGAGKTTFLALLSGALPPTAGRMVILGHPVGHPALLGSIGVLTQDAALRRGVPAYEQLLHMGRLTRRDRHAVRRELDAILAELDAGNFARGRPEALSFGQRKRLGIAQALLGEPRVLLLDEPTAGLDPNAARVVRDVIVRRATTAAVILSSHNLYEIGDICRRVLVVDRGQLINDSDLSAIALDSDTLTLRLDRELHPGVRALLAQLPEITELRCDDTTPGMVVIHVASPDINRVQMQLQAVLVDNGYSILSLARGKTLADGVFQLMEGR